jgi:hypothetical protein
MRCASQPHPQAKIQHCLTTFSRKHTQNRNAFGDKFREMIDRLKTGTTKIWARSTRYSLAPEDDQAK